jgi:hypothetical protein
MASEEIVALLALAAGSVCAVAIFGALDFPVAARIDDRMAVMMFMADMSYLLVMDMPFLTWIWKQ